jgi:hypothetical protein
MSIDLLLSRLNKVRRTSHNSWIACCPAHEDRKPSFTIRDAGDGRILLHCFGGCATENILAAVGMTWEDVMPEKPIAHRVEPEKVKVYATDALRAIQNEARIVAVAAFDLKAGRALGKPEHDRLMLAVERINTAVELANVQS